MITPTVLDYIHDYICIEGGDLDCLQNEFTLRETVRLEGVGHLGLVNKLRRLARHDKLEHAYGTYWLCKQCADLTRGLIDYKKAFRIAGFLHGIGHLPFSYDTEYAVAKLYQLHPGTKNWIDSVLERCAEFTNNARVEKAAQRMKSTMEHTRLYLWFGVWKLSRSGTNEFNNTLGRSIANILLDSEAIESQLLVELDRIDYVLRDMFYLAQGKIDLNLAPLLSQFKKAEDDQLSRPALLGLINVTHDYLCDEVYMGPEERCLAQVLDKALMREILEGRHSVEEILELNDRHLDNILSSFCRSEASLDDAIARIKARRLEQVAQIVCDIGDNQITSVEAKLVGTNKAGIGTYPKSRGIYVQCMPDPYNNKPDAYEWIDSGASVSIVYDFDSACPQHVIGALIKAESWAPDNPYGMELPSREEALKFLLGLHMRPQFERYQDVAVPLITAHMPKPEEEWKPEIFHESWARREEAVEALFYEYELDWPWRHFLRFPEHWNTDTVQRVLDEVERKRARMRRRHRRSSGAHDDRPDKLLEYSTYLKTVLRIRQQGMSGWVLPSVKMLTEDGEEYAEVDVVAFYVPVVHRGPVIMELIEVSLGVSDENELRNRRKLKKVANRVRTRFGRKVHVVGSFNGQEIVRWPTVQRRQDNTDASS